jgi:tetratricopeptide (TPR) repeat protein
MRIFLIYRAMGTLSSAVQTAAGAFQQISDTALGERRRRATTGAMVLRVVEGALDGQAGTEFLTIRAAAEVSALPRGAERSILRRLLELAEGSTEETCAGTLSMLLVEYACEVERTQRLPEADAALALATTVAPQCAEVALHAGRVARKLRDPERALALYTRARELDRSGGVARLAAIGEAVVSADPERALGRVIRGAVVAGDAEAAAVGLEERARVRRTTGKRCEAIRDLCIAALRFPDAVDRARAAHEVADVAITMGDVRTAREALLVAVACGDPAQRDHARGRLHTLSRDQGDQLGMRRWRTFTRPTLVSLSLSRAAPGTSSSAVVFARWRDSLEQASASA